MLSNLHPLILGLLPELVLVIGASLILLIGLSKSRGLSEATGPLSLLTIALAVLATWYVTQTPPPRESSLMSDMVLWYTRLLGLIVGLLILMANRHVPEEADRGEFHGLLLFSFAGILLVAAANDLILLFLALELVSVPTYILVGLSRRDVRAQEATVKYFFLGAFAAALTLYGFSFLYGATGTMRLTSGPGHEASILAALTRPGALSDPLVLIGLLLAFAGLAFKIAAVPLHFYVADVYQGAASPVTGMLGFVPKFAGFVAITRLLSLCGWMTPDSIFWLLWAIAALTMTVGNTLALWQNNVKRMLAYSGIAHSGYALVGLVAGPGKTDALSPMRNGLTAVFFYLVIYGVMNLGAFAALSYFRKDTEEGEDSAETLDDLAGCARRHPWAALAFAICVLSLMGLPPTGGFLGKVYLFSSALAAAADVSRHGADSYQSTALVVLVVIAVLNSAVAAAYYLRIVASLFVRAPVVATRPSRCPTLIAAIAACAIIVVLVFIAPSSLFKKAQDAVADLRPRPYEAFTMVESHP